MNSASVSAPSQLVDVLRTTISYPTFEGATTVPSPIRCMNRPSWEFGVTRRFGTADLNRDSLLYGWSEPESDHIWNDGPEASQRIVIPWSDFPLALSLECLPFIGGACLRQDVTLYVNGMRVKFWRLRTGEIHHLDAVIDPHFLAEEGYDNLLNCIWHLPRSTSPRDAGTGDDSRELGLCFRALTISQIGVPSGISQFAAD